MRVTLLKACGFEWLADLGMLTSLRDHIQQRFPDATVDIYRSGKIDNYVSNLEGDFLVMITDGLYCHPGLLTLAAYFGRLPRSPAA